jgi:Zn-dependent protease with chaperone function
MISKPLSLILVYILTIINLVIITTPFVVAFAPVLLIFNNSYSAAFVDLMFICVFLASSTMLIYIMLDILFGISIWGLLRNCKLIESYLVEYPILNECNKNFKKLKSKFNKPGVKLYISNEDAINAYAISSLVKNVVVITMPLIEHMLENSEDEGEFNNSLNAIMCHEFSHLINKDSLPGLILLANGKATHLISKFVYIIFNLLIRIFIGIPFFGHLIKLFLESVYAIADKFVNLFHKYVILNVYEFIKLHIGRQIEFRCDREGANACGGENMANALSYFGDNGYFTIFSTHPRTKTRIKKVHNIKISSNKIDSSVVSRLSNFFSVFLLVIVFFVALEEVSIYLIKYSDTTQIQISLDDFVQRYADKINQFDDKYLNFDTIIKRFK